MRKVFGKIVMRLFWGLRKKTINSCHSVTMNDRSQESKNNRLRWVEKKSGVSITRVVLLRVSQVEYNIVNEDIEIKLELYFLFG